MKIYAVGLGPGEKEQITGKALDVLRQCDVIVGYPLYIELLGEIAKDKVIRTTPMRQEVERCEMAVNEALQGKTVAIVSSGDAGVYGMAGVLIEVAAAYPQMEVVVVSGVTAACSAAAVLGAPLMHDFAVISLSDLLTPWAQIEKRLRFAAEADFVLCLYNPASKKRADYLAKACAIIGTVRDQETPCGLVRNAGRDDEWYTVLPLHELAEKSVDMLTTVFIGNSTTKVVNGRLVTPRGYRGLDSKRRSDS